MLNCLGRRPFAFTVCIHVNGGGGGEGEGGGVQLHTCSGNEVEHDRSLCVQVSLACPLEAHGSCQEKVSFNCTVNLSVESVVGPR